LLRQELRLLLRGQPLWWYLGAVSIVAAGVIGRLPRLAIVSIAVIWPLLVWSSMGCRPVRDRLLPLVISSRAARTQPLAEWAAGFSSPPSSSGPRSCPRSAPRPPPSPSSSAGPSSSAPSTAQALGAWTGSSRPFEFGYLVLWYAGPLNAVTPVDFAGATGTTAGTATPVVFEAIGLAALAATMVRRKART
jgi:hypothetical protein